ncbi:MAG: ParA family protein [Spirochaetes bacterium]|uniref:ParA family protein n=1 Tax=Candidatus Ornithospirochaeta stercoravium TaxID=2840897 RepID=A0A9D9IDK9_9SPIO|nr:ParA family protein [Candidatus Ornithospirochaeta stercoravium]
MKIIMVANQKGGVGKTTTASALGLGLKKKGFRVLLVDTDPQGNLTASLGINPDSAKGLSELLYDDAGISECISSTFAGDLIPCSIMLADADRRLTQPYAYSLLGDKLQTVSGNYDFCIIDAPPSLGILSLNGFNAADYLIVPVNASAFSLQGLSSLFEIVSVVKDKGKHDIRILGILLTRYNGKTNLSKEVLSVLEATAAEAGTKIFDAKIRQGIAVEMAQAKRTDLYEFRNGSKPADDYRKLTEEVLGLIN